MFKSRSQNLALNLLLILGASAAPGCDTAPAHGGDSTVESAGAVALTLQGTSVTLNTVSYSITGPNTYAGTINVTSSTALSATISGIVAGPGYTLMLSATATDGQTTCGGTSAPFAVAAHATTPVTVMFDCHAPRTTGSVGVTGTINVCPRINAVSANPPSGNTIAISILADDLDGGPGPLTYGWTAAAGTLSSANAPNPTLTCAAPGPTSLTLTVSDGDPACAETFNLLVTCPPDSALNEAAWVEIGANNQAIARLNTPYGACPAITVDGVTSTMTVRALPGTMPLRTSSTDTTLAMAMTSGNTKPSIFTTTTCEFLLPAGALKATVAGLNLPLPKPVVNRVVIIGDSGCRISIGNVYQACQDPAVWPFSVIAAAAAALQPDLVLHVGDYHYRDNPCPAGNTACAGEVWGYGSDAWAADLFVPAAPLLKAAPWVMVRGNHETCNRGGQGWYRYLDPNPYDTTNVKTCNVDANDSVGNYNDPWAVSFGDTQFVVFDSANTSKSVFSPPAFQPYTTQLAAAAALAPANLLNIWAVHHPILGYTAGNPPAVGNPGMQSVMNAAYPGNYYPANTGMAIHGHVHDFQAINFASNHPATIVAGNSGDNLDTPLPAVFNPTATPPAANTVVKAFAFSQAFGFMVMDRVGEVGLKSWKLTAYRTNGTVIATCTTAASSACSGVCDTTPGTQLNCVDGSGAAVGLYQNIP